jgi:hypothetical protein
MSGVLDRMAKRALGALPTVHPLLAPYFAPTDGIAREALLQPEASLGPGTRLEIDASDSRATPPRAPPWQTRDNWKRPDPEHRQTLGEVAALPSSAGEKPPVRIDDRQPQDPVQPLQPHAVHRVVDLEAIAKPNPVDKSPVSLEPAPQVRRTGGERQWQTDLPEPATPITPLVRFADATPDDVAHLAHENQTTRLPAKVRDHPRSESRPAFLPARRIEQAVGGADTDHRSAVTLTRSADQKAEIHISIGRIELRAPPAQAIPSAAPYRPRVTLEDFLRRKPEASG